MSQPIKYRGYLIEPFGSGTARRWLVSDRAGVPISWQPTPERAKWRIDELSPARSPLSKAFLIAVGILAAILALLVSGNGSGLGVVLFLALAP